MEEAEVDVNYHLIKLLTVDVMAKKLFTVDVTAQKGMEISLQFSVFCPMFSSEQLPLSVILHLS